MPATVVKVDYDYRFAEYEYDLEKTGFQPFDF